MFDPWAQAAKANHAGPQASHALPARMNWDASAWDMNSTKTSKELKPPNGTVSAYRTWANRVEDHLSEKNPDWLVIFNDIDKQKEPINKETLRTSVPKRGRICI